MGNDTLVYDSLDNRPLPKWLTDQRDGLNTYQPEEYEIRKDKSLEISFLITVGLILLIVWVSGLYYLRKIKKNSR